MPVVLHTSRFSPTRLIRTSPESPEADSRLVNATTVTVSAKIRFDHVGALPRWIGSSQTFGSKKRIMPSTTMKACSAMSPASRIPTRRARRVPKPRMLLSTTTAMKTSASPSAAPLSPR